jgi:hypothetical protein
LHSLVPNPSLTVVLLRVDGVIMCLPVALGWVVARRGAIGKVVETTTAASSVVAECAQPW